MALFYLVLLGDKSKKNSSYAGSSFGLLRFGLYLP